MFVVVTFLGMLLRPSTALIVFELRLMILSQRGVARLMMELDVAEPMLDMTHIGWKRKSA